MNEYRNKVKWCPVCDQGWVRFAKDPTIDQVYLICDECECEWRHPEEIRNGNGTQDFFKAYEEVSIEELKVIGWSGYVIEN